MSLDLGAVSSSLMVGCRDYLKKTQKNYPFFFLILRLLLRKYWNIISIFLSLIFHLTDFSFCLCFEGIVVILMSLSDNSLSQFSIVCMLQFYFIWGHIQLFCLQGLFLVLPVFCFVLPLPSVFSPKCKFELLQKLPPAFYNDSS